jgi:hypothetical protein
MSEQPERNKFIYDDEDNLEVFDFEDLEVKAESKKAIAASAILGFKIENDEKE